MPYTDNGKNTMLDAIGVTHVALGQLGSALSITGLASTDVITATGHGYSNGDLVILTALTGGAGLTASAPADQPYFVVSVTTNTFKLSKTSGGTAIDITTDISAGTVRKVAELTGGSPAYARKAITFAAAAGGIKDDSTNGAVFDVPAGAVVDFALYFDALTVGNLKGNSRLAGEAFVGQGQYTLTDAKLDLNS